MKRLILSFYYYAKVKDDVHLFDAWWQFIHSLGLFCIGIVFIFLNLVLAIFRMPFNPLLIFGIFGIVYILSLIFNDYRGTNFHAYVLNEYTNCKPFKNYILILFRIILFLGVVFSANLNRYMGV